MGGGTSLNELSNTDTRGMGVFNTFNKKSSADTLREEVKNIPQSLKGRGVKTFNHVNRVLHTFCSKEGSKPHLSSPRGVQIKGRSNFLMFAMF